MATLNPMPPAAAWGYAAQWGSFLTNGDPGACMYGFDATFTVQSEAHRAECLAWIDGCRADVKSTPENFEVDELAQLDALESAVRIALTAAQLQAREDRLDEFTRAYITAALWSSIDDEGDPLDDNYGLGHLADETFAEMVEDCRAFQAAHPLCATNPSQGGHDLWLTRCGHGAGFWDRGDAAWEKLAEPARALGNVDLYVGDDGRIHA